MATIANHVTDIVALVKFLEERETSFTADAVDADSIVSGAAGDIDGSLAALFQDDGAQSFRRSTLAQPTQILARRGFDTIAQQIAKTLNQTDVPPGTSAAQIYGIGLRRHMIDNTKVFESRGVTNSAPSAITGTGTGAVNMLSTDDQGTADELENVNAETLTFLCKTVAGQGGVESGNEIFEIRGELARRDIHENGGSGSDVVATMSSVCATQSNLQVVGNTDFNATLGSDATSVTKIQNWTIDVSAAASTWTADSTNYFRSKRDGTAGQGINIAYVAADSKITQRISQLPGAGPIYCSIRWMRLASATGDFILRVGGASATGTIGSGTNGVWNKLSFWAYPTDFTGGGVDVEIAVETLATGTVTFDELVIASPDWIGGKAFVIDAGATDFAYDDTTTQVTTAADTGTVLKWLYRTYYPSYANPFGSRDFPLNLPHDGTASVGWEDP